MPTINSKACVVNDKPVDKVYSNGVQVYGRNMLINTASSSTNRFTKLPGAGVDVSGEYSRTDRYEQVIYRNSNEFYYRPLFPDVHKLYGLTRGEVYTFSGSVSQTVGSLYFRSGYAKNGFWNESDVSDLRIPVSDGSVFTTFSYTFTIPVWATGAYFSLQIFNNNSLNNGDLFRFKNMKLEKGKIATPWTPAPEDVGVGA